MATTRLVERRRSVTAGAPLLSIVPGGVALRGQSSPFWRFDSARSVVKEISRTLIAPGNTQLPVSLAEPANRVTVALDRPTIRVHGNGLPLRAGMQLEADIALDRRP